MPIQSTDTTATILVSANAESWLIKEGVVVATSDIGFVSNFTETSLLNYGHVSGTDRGVFINGDKGFIDNHSTGVIESQNVAIQMSGPWARLVNDGLVRGGEFGVGTSTDRVYIDNSGEITGARVGLTLSFNESAHVQNQGEIRSNELALWFDGLAGSKASLVNAGEVSGGDAAIQVTSGAGLNLRNSGIIDGAVTLDASTTASSLLNTGLIYGDVSLGRGADRFDGRGGEVHGAVDGGAGADRLIGGAYDDTLAGGLGRDLMDGGKGEDLFIFTDVKDSRPNAADLITNHFALDDLIDLSAIDANRSASGFQHLRFAGLVAEADPLTVGRVGYYKHGGETFVVFDTSGDGVADFTLQIHGAFNLTAGEFVL
jgi:hypothetical protein